MTTSIDHFISRRPRCRPCPACKGLMLAGIDEGIPYRVDPVPLNPTGELVALCSGLRTYEWKVTGHVAHRNHYRMRTDQRYGHPIVLATHRHNFTPELEHLASVHAAKAMGLLNMASRRTVKDEDPENEMVQENAIYTVAGILTGKVWVCDEQPPF